MQVPKDVLPTLIIGLGGTGHQVIKRVKELFKKRYNNEKLPIRYLLIDTDLKSFMDDSIENNEKCQLKFGDGIKNTLDWAYNNLNFNWLPKNPKLTADFFTAIDQGAGLMRPIGRLYLCKNAKLTYDVLTNAKNDLMDIHKILTDYGSAFLENIDRQKVYIVGSLAGGTGCGVFLDVAVMLSKIFNRDNTNLIGLFTLESCYDDKLSSDIDAQNRSKANCYAALKELEFYMSSITNPKDEKYLFKYNNMTEIRLERRLLDVCYLIENKNELGGVLTNIEDIYELCSLQLFQEVGSKLGSQLRADYSNFICKDKDPVLKKDRNFSTFSTSTMELPIDKLKSYCSLRFAKDIMDTLEKGMGNSDSIIDNEAESFISNINETLGINETIVDFSFNLKINSSATAFELKEGSLSNLDKAQRFAKERKALWNQNKTNLRNELNTLLMGYIDEKLVGQGINFIIEVFNKVETKMYNEYTEGLVTTSIDKEKIKGEIQKLKNTKGFLRREKVTIGSELCGKFNKYIEQEQNKLIFDIYKERYDMYIKQKALLINKFQELISSIRSKKGEILYRLRALKNQLEKKYGGSIISREMVNVEFYEEFYSEKFLANLTNRIQNIFMEKDVFKIINEALEGIIAICNMEFEKIKGNINIINLMERNAVKEKLSIEDYLKEELDATTKLAKPFWSAVKNPEVSWTECYYVGSIKEEGTNKPPMALDSWIKNQTGELSRQARYVETSNPYAIDVIHITMGACASYLPDIKNYKKHYVKLLASEAYPLHLDEKYIGFEEIDMNVDKLLQYYSLAKAYGGILQIDGSFYLNIRARQGTYNYIYYTPYCIRGAYAEERPLEIPDNKSKLRSDFKKLGEGKEDVLESISEDLEVNSLIYGFIEDIDRIFTREELKKHCLEVYIKGKVEPDFIAKEKLLYKLN
ncbi:tubulin-like doman-containing protein [Candidatus Clostridium radicumherbarum]|uniref:Tubulin-like doman-containing protein n=1 Tax=Candidatus Clostridium radicumherbarum TaxID=3381662 RepID=A0ABW8TWY8_9CLOT